MPAVTSGDNVEPLWSFAPPLHLAQVLLVSKQKHIHPRLILTCITGTAAPGTNGCISNCGVDIIHVTPPVNQFMRIGYYEGWTGSRSCLKMDVSDITFFGANVYTHVHFAFGSITTDYKVSIGADVAAQFAKFVAVPQGSFKKILSFGGWSFSTDVDSFPIFRTGVTSANRQTFANNVVNFIVANGLDGVDFDWEYPGQLGLILVTLQAL